MVSPSFPGRPYLGEFFWVPAVGCVVFGSARAGAYQGLPVPCSSFFCSLLLALIGSVVVTQRLLQAGEVRRGQEGWSRKVGL